MLSQFSLAFSGFPDIHTWLKQQTENIYANSPVY